MRKRRSSLFALIFLLLALPCASQQGDFFHRYYSPKSYASGQFATSPQNWDLCRDDRGVLYIANTSCILEFDGRTWNYVRGTHYLDYHLVAADPAGTVYVAASDEFGYIAPDSIGNPQFVSLLKGTKLENLNLGVPEDLEFADGHIWAVYPDHLISSHTQKIEIDSSFSANTCIFSHNQETFLAAGDSLYKRNSDRWEFSCDLTGLPDGTIRGVFSRGNETIRIFHSPGGIWDIDKENPGQGLKHRNSPLDGEIYQKVVPVGDKLYLIPGGKNGVWLVDDQGETQNLASNAEYGNYLKCYNGYLDPSGLWLALEEGISWLDFYSATTIFNEGRGLQGVPIDIVEWNDRLVVGTIEGAFISEKGMDAAGNLTFTKIPEVSNGIFALKEWKGEVLMGGIEGCWRLGRNGKVEKQFSSRVTELQELKGNEDLLLAGSYKGVILMQEVMGKWEVVDLVEGIDFPVYSILEQEDGWIWACDEEVARFRIRDEAEQRTYEVELFGPDEGFSEKLNVFRPYQWNDQTLFGTFQGLFRWSEAEKKLVPFGDFGEKFTEKGHTAMHLTTAGGNIWIESEETIGRLFPSDDGTYRWDPSPSLSLPRTDTWRILPGSDGSAWFCTNEGLVRFSPHNPVSELGFHAMIRKVFVGGDSLIFGGMKTKDSVDVMLDYRDRNITFHFSAPEYRHPEELQFSTFLMGYEQDWTSWSSEVRKEFTNLKEGNYIFRVRARDREGNISTSDAYSFSVRRPWYRSLLAYIGYGVFIFLFISLIVWLNSRRLIRQKQRLEAIVKQRTAELASRNDELHDEKKKSDQLLLNILPEATAEELKKEGRAIPRKYDSVSVLFTDFKNFSLISDQLSPEELVFEIDEIYRLFDREVKKAGIEKIKTIGDSYMAASGLPTPSDDHAIRMVNLGLNLCKVLRERRESRSETEEQEFHIRVGIHSGPVVAGVVGEIKYAYDIWGDTVNVAARMESSGEPGIVNISGATFDRVWRHFLCRYRGPIPAKNVGNIDMFYVETSLDRLKSGPEALSERYFQVREEIYPQLENHLSPELHYHHFPHTAAVEAAAWKLAQGKISNSEMELLLVAAILHDSGFLHTVKDHEEASCAIAREKLPAAGYHQEEIESICRMIMATKLPQQPQDKLSEILCDADLYYLGTRDYYAVAEGLFQEFRHYGVLETPAEWLAMQIRFLEGHNYFTSEARELLDESKLLVMKGLKEEAKK